MPSLHHSHLRCHQQTSRWKTVLLAVIVLIQSLPFGEGYHVFIPGRKANLRHDETTFTSAMKTFQPSLFRAPTFSTTRQRMTPHPFYSPTKSLYSRTMLQVATNNDGNHDDDENSNDSENSINPILRIRRKIFQFFQWFKRLFSNSKSNNNKSLGNDKTSTGTTYFREQLVATPGSTKNAVPSDDKNEEEDDNAELPMQREKEDLPLSSSSSTQQQHKQQQHKQAEEDAVTASTTTTTSTRWAVAANSTDLSGTWKPIVTAEFKRKYDEYLLNCSQSVWFRKLAISTIGLVVDEIQQDGKNLTMTSRNPAGSWTRTLVGSGVEEPYNYNNDNNTNDNDNGDFEPLLVDIRDPDSDAVTVEAWWEKQGTVHRSILRGKPRVKGGEFETLRYLEQDEENDGDTILITESYFHPSPESSSSSSFKPGYVRWKFRRTA